MQKYIDVNHIDITKKSGRLGVSQQDDGSKFIKMKENVAKQKAEDARIAQETEDAIKHIKEAWNFPSLEEIKKSSNKAIVQSKGYRKYQIEKIQNDYKKNSTALLAIKPYLPQGKPLGFFMYRGIFRDSYRSIALFEDKVITYSSRNITIKEMIKKKIYNCE
ncbi:MAG: hypothetical protein R3Y46_07920 [Opitutales bacterium]